MRFLAFRLHARRSFVLVLRLRLSVCHHLRLAFAFALALALLLVPACPCPCLRSRVRFGFLLVSCFCISFAHRLCVHVRALIRYVPSRLYSHCIWCWCCSWHRRHWRLDSRWHPCVLKFVIANALAFVSAFAFHLCPRHLIHQFFGPAAALPSLYE